jgi:hypothetical protein
VNECDTSVAIQLARVLGRAEMRLLASSVVNAHSSDDAGVIAAVPVQENV